MRFWPALPTILKFSTVVVWPVVMEWSYIGEGPFGIPSASLQMFLKTLQCILHHTSACHT